MINPITNSDTDEFLHWYLITPMDECHNNIRTFDLHRLDITVTNPPEWDSLRAIYNRCINFTKLKVYMDNK